jgi:hypothetical protein
MLVFPHCLPAPREDPAVTHALLCYVALLAVSDEAYLAWISEAGGVDALPPTAGQRLSSAELAALADGKPIMPYADATVAVRAPDGGIWAGSPGGLMYLAPQAARWRLFHSRRWLPADDVQDLSVGKKGDVLARTSRGIVRLARRETTLQQKMDAIDELLQAHHVERGYVGGINFEEAGNVEAGHSQHSNDNDGLWTSLYVAAEAFRYAVTRDPAARQNARRSLEALMFLERVSGIPGFCARSIVPIEEEVATRRGEWHRSADGKWWWKGDTSSDEVDGHYFAYFIYYNAAADDKEKQEIREYVARITDHILDNGLHYVGPPGVPTTWGVWSPQKLNHDLRRIGDRGLNSLEILSFLKVAEYMVGKPRYTEKLKELIEEHAYATNTVLQKQVWPPQRVNHSDDELAFVAYYPLLLLERDAELREKYLASIRRSWTVERPEQSPFFNFIYGAALQASAWTDPSKQPDAALVDPLEYDRKECLEWFRDVPADTIGWTVINSKRRDVGEINVNRFRRARGQVVLPPSERHVMKWNGDPYALDGGGDGRYRDDGTFILLPYWMGRYHRLID